MEFSSCIYLKVCYWSIVFELHKRSLVLHLLSQFQLEFCNGGRTHDIRPIGHRLQDERKGIVRSLHGILWEHKKKTWGKWTKKNPLLTSVTTTMKIISSIVHCTTTPQLIFDFDQIRRRGESDCGRKWTRKMEYPVHANVGIE